MLDANKTAFRFTMRNLLSSNPEAEKVNAAFIEIGKPIGDGHKISLAADAMLKDVGVCSDELSEELFGSKIESRFNMLYFHYGRFDGGKLPSAMIYCTNAYKNKIDPSAFQSKDFLTAPIRVKSLAIASSWFDELEGSCDDYEIGDRVSAARLFLLEQTFIGLVCLRFGAGKAERINTRIGEKVYLTIGADEYVELGICAKGEFKMLRSKGRVIGIEG